MGPSDQQCTISIGQKLFWADSQPARQEEVMSDTCNWQLAFLKLNKGMAICWGQWTEAGCVTAAWRLRKTGKLPYTQCGVGGCGLPMTPTIWEAQPRVSPWLTTTCAAQYFDSGTGIRFFVLRTQPSTKSETAVKFFNPLRPDRNLWRRGAKRLSHGRVRVVFR